MIRAAVEYNNQGYLCYAVDFPGASGRGRTKQDALDKLKKDVYRYIWWIGASLTNNYVIEIVQEYKSLLHIEDADTDILLEKEALCITLEEYSLLKKLVLKSAKDFQMLYESFPKKLFQDIPVRKTFYGNVCSTPNDMYAHTNNVTAYYMDRLSVVIEFDDNIVENRIKAFESLEQNPDFLLNQIFIDSNKEYWCLRKVLRRFIWHDTIHAKAMYRLGLRTWRSGVIADPFGFCLLEQR